MAARDIALQAVVSARRLSASCSTTLAERDGQPRSCSRSSNPRRKQQTSSNTPANSGPHASSANRTRCRDATIRSVISPTLFPRELPPVGVVQLEVTRGVNCARVKSARNFSPATNCVGSIMARPSRPLRRASHANGLSLSFIRTRATPASVMMSCTARSRCRALKALTSGPATVAAVPCGLRLRRRV